MALEHFAACAGCERSTISARRRRNAHFLGIVRRTKPFLYVDSGSAFENTRRSAVMFRTTYLPYIHAL